MALATTNPIRLADAHVMCTGEFLICPEHKGLGWLMHMPCTLNGVNPLMPEMELATSLVIASAPQGYRTGLVLRLRMLDDYATPQQCEAAREDRMPHFERHLADAGLNPVRPLGEEGVYTLLPREGLRILRRATSLDGTPAPHSDATQIDLQQLEELVAAHPGSGLCITFFPRSLTEQMEDVDFLVATWGMPGAATEFINRLHLPLTECPEIDPRAQATGFHFLYDPWALRERIRKQSRRIDLTAASLVELQQLFGRPVRPTPAPAEPAAPATPLQAARALMDSVTAMRQGMRDAGRALTQDMKEQVTQAVMPQLGGVTLQLTDLPGAVQGSLHQALERMIRMAGSLSPQEMATEARSAGMDAPIDTLTLMKMGFNSEQELLDAGLAPELLTLLRTAIHLREQCPAPGDEMNCIPYAFMTGYLYEALVNRCFAPLFRATGGNPNAHFLSDYTRVNEAHVQRMAEYAGRHSTALRSLSARDWAAWMTLCNAIRSLRNRQHSDRAPGFISHSEMAAAHEVFFFPGQSAKLTLLRLPAFSATPPAWSKTFTPNLPAAWGVTTDAQRTAVVRHISSRASAFSASMLQFLLRCGSLAPKEDDAC